MYLCRLYSSLQKRFVEAFQYCFHNIVTLVRFSLTWICFFLTKSSHGFVRNRFWKIEAHPLPVPSSHHSSSALVDLIRRSSSQDDLKIWPHKFIYRLRVALGHRGDLTLTSRVRNTDVEGLHGVNYLDQQKNRTRFTDHDKAITFNVDKLGLDRLYLNTPNKIVVHKEGQIDAVVWNPWEKKVSDLGVEDYSRFVAVESAAVHKPIILEPGKEWKGILQMSVVPSS
ncbi:unnamed protein product [Brassica napus]|uniref:(rape) hypothetical protein n=1 Tax=Brassica napus TaxID=3708 RepID=A0A816UEG6_BRANA|nr:unnamed protein product [Brassica napus]